ncbi:MAG: biopolymer transporter ExbD [Bacteroidota bacterium]
MARKTPEIPSASMADIAFMLLIFFLVATTMDMDIGLTRLLPPIPEDIERPETVEINKRNVFVVLINKHDQLLVNNAYMKVDDVREKTKEFIKNPALLDNLSDKESLSFLKEKTTKENNLKAAANFQDAIDLLKEDFKRSKGVVSLQNDRGTSYEMYIKVQNELVAAFNELRDELAKEKFGKKFDDLVENEQEAVKTAIPQAISEAEPKNVR